MTRTATWMSATLASLGATAILLIIDLLAGVPPGGAFHLGLTLLSLLFLLVAFDHARRRMREPGLVVKHHTEFIRQCPAAIAMLDRDLRYLAASERYVSDFGLTGSLEGRLHYEVFPDIPERWKAVHRRALAGETLSETDDPYLRADGSTEYLHWVVRPLREASGEVGGIMMFSEMVTERKRAEDESARAHDQLRAAIDAIPDGVMITDARGVPVFLSAPARRMLEPDGAPVVDFATFSKRYSVRDRDGNELSAADLPAARVLRGETLDQVDYAVVNRVTGEEWRRRASARAVHSKDGRAELAVVVTRDTTQEVKAAREGARLKGEFEALLDTQELVGFATLDSEGRFLELNRVWTRLLGYEPSDLKGKHWQTISVPEDEAADRVAENTARSGELVRREKRFRKKDGSSVWVTVMVSPVRVEGEAPRRLAVLIDIGERRNAELALADSQNRYRTLFEAARVGLAEVDAQTGSFHVVNAELAHMLGYEASELVGKSWKDLTHPEHVEDDLERYRQMLADGEGYTRQKRYLRKDGTPVWVEITLAPLWKKGETPTRHALVVQDLTERRAAAEALLASERRFRAMIERSSDVLVVLDGDFKVQFWSPSAVEQLRLTPDEAKDLLFPTLIDPRGDERPEDALKRCVAHPETLTHTWWRVRTRDGGLRTFEVTLSNQLADPAIHGLVANLRDVTERTRLAEQLHQAQKLEGLGRLAGGIAHDFNNLLTVILSCSEMLREDLVRGSASVDDVIEIARAGERAKRLTAQLLAFARKQPVELVPIDLNAAVTDARKLLERVIGEDVELVTTLEDGKASIVADPSQLEQVLLNLVLFTERVNTARQLREDRARADAQLRAAVEAMGDGLSIFTKDGQPLFVSEVAARQLGCDTQEEAFEVLRTFDRHFELIDAHGQPVPLLQSPGARASAGETLDRAQFRVRRVPSGEERIWQFSARPVLGPDGQVELSVVVVHDHTDAAAIDRRLAATQARLETMFENTDLGVAQVDPVAERFVEVNGNFARMLGYEVSELVGHHVSEFSPGELEADREAGARARLGEVVRRDKHYRKKDGSTLFASLTLAPFRIAGAPPAVLAFVVDLGKQRAVEARLEASERRFTTLFREAGVGLAELDVTTGRFLHANPALTQLLGYSEDELRTKTWLELTFPDDLPSCERLIAGLVANGTAFSGEKRYVRRDGTTVWTEIVTAPLWGKGEAPTSAVLVLNDLSSRRAATDALARSEQRFRALIERASDMVVVLDGERRVQFWSPSAVDQLGLTADEVLGKPIEALLEHDDEDEAEHVQGMLAELAHTRDGVARTKWKVRTREGSARLLEVVLRNLLDDPAVGGVVANLRDVTEQQQLTEQLHQAQKLEGLGRLAGGIAHDFNNLLTVILSCSEVLKEELPRGAASVEDVNEIFKAGERARRLTQQLLAFARRQPLDPSSLDLNRVVTDCRGLLDRMLGEDIELVTKLGEGVGTVRADPSQLEQVLLNLAINARDAMPGGGTLTLETRPVDATWVQLRVSDTGTGMSPEVKAHLFEPFFTTKPVGKGTGLGLAVVWGAITQAGGQIQVESEPGAGTTFVLSLQRREAEVTVEHPRVTRAEATHETVLVVEDETSVRQALVNALRTGGYRVIGAGTPEEGLAIAEGLTSPPDLVVSDVVMPRHDGRWLVEQLRSKGLAPRVLFVSGYTADVVTQHGVRDVGLEFLSKPFTPTVLRERVRRLLDAPGITSARQPPASDPRA
ncbi:MAG: PAS domain S-box protein [Myxococcaceae bacterium]